MHVKLLLLNMTYLLHHAQLCHVSLSEKFQETSEQIKGIIWPNVYDNAEGDERFALPSTQLDYLYPALKKNSNF